MKPIVLLFAVSILSAGSSFSDEEGELPDRLQSLVDSYDREKRRVLEPVNRKFDAALLELREQFTKAGRLEDAVATDKIIAARKEEDAPKKEVRKSTTRWKWGSGGTLTLEAGGKAMHSSWTEPGTWKDNPDGTVTLTSQYNVSIITFAEDGSGTVKAENSGGRGTTLTQID